MNRPAAPLVTLLLVLLAVPCIGVAQSTTPEQAPVTANDAASQPPTPAQDEATADKDKDKLHASPYCLQHTGSMIRQTGGRPHCTAIGDAYTREDLQRTGATDIGDALRRLDASIR